MLVQLRVYQILNGRHVQTRVGSLYNSWEEIINALVIIKDETFEKWGTRNESKSLYNQMQKLETSFMVIFF